MSEELLEQIGFIKKDNDYILDLHNQEKLINTNFITCEDENINFDKGSMITLTSNGDGKYNLNYNSGLNLRNFVFPNADIADITSFIQGLINVNYVLQGISNLPNCYFEKLNNDLNIINPFCDKQYGDFLGETNNNIITLDDPKKEYPLYPVIKEDLLQKIISNIYNQTSSLKM